MRIAVATDNGRVSEHFGRCPSYTLADIENGIITHREVVENPGHEPGRIPHLLQDHGTDVIVAGGMGRRAQQLFSEMGIEQVLGVTGPVEDAIEGCRTGSIEGGSSLCAHPEGHGDGHGHEGGHGHGPGDHHQN